MHTTRRRSRSGPFAVAARLTAGTMLVGAVALSATLPAAAQADPFAPDDSVSTAPTASLLQFGWWNKAQQSPVGGTPVPLPPGAPSNGIFIVYGPSGTPPPAAVTGPLGAVPTVPAPAPTAPRPLGPEAFGAVRYSVPPGADATLTFRYTPTSTSQPGAVNPDVGDLFACPVTRTWDPVQNGRYDSAPSYDCGTGVAATVAAGEVTFALPATLNVDGLYDLALVPMGTRPYKVGFEAPSDGSIALMNVPESAPEESFDAGTFEDPALLTDPAFDDGSTFTADDLGAATFDEFSAGDFSAGEFTSSTGPVARAPRAGTAAPSQVAVPAAIANPFRKDASRSERLMAVAILGALAAALFWIGGQPVRAPRLLGSLGAGQPVDVAMSPDTGGIGRFARPRGEGRPRRLF